MIRLEIINDRGDRVELEVKDLSIQLTFQADDLVKLGKSSSAHSLSFKLPFSDVNNKEIGFFEIVGQSVDTRTTRDAVIYEDGYVIFQGKLSVRGCDLQGKYYDCVVYSSESGVYQKLRTSTWRDVFTSAAGYVTTALDHAHNGQSIKDSNGGIDVTAGGVGADVIYYPLQYTRIYHVNQDLSTIVRQTFLNAQGTGLRILSKDFLPSISVKYLLENLFRHCGYRLDTSVGVFDESPFILDDLYQVLPREWLQYRPYFSASVTMSGVNENGLTLTGSNTANNPELYYAYFTQQTGDYDPDGFFGGFGPPYFGGFVPPVQGIYNMELELHWSGPNFFNDMYIGVLPYNFTTGEYGTPVHVTIPVAQDTATLYFQITHNSTFESVYLPILLWNISSSSISVNLLASQCKLRMVSYIGDSPTLQVAMSLGEDTLDKWLAAMIEQFNLVLTFNKDAESCALFRRESFFNRDTTNAIDWTEKVDRSQPMRLTNNLEALNQVVTFKNADMEDGQSLWERETQGYYKTHHTFRPKVPMAQGSQEIGGYFALPRFRKAADSVTCTQTTYAFDTMRGIQAYKRDDKTDATCDAVVLTLNKKPILVYRGGAVTEGIRIYDTAEPTDSNYTFVNSWLQPTIIKGGMYLSWGKNTSYDGFAVNTIQSLFEYAYEKELNRTYSVDARTLTASVLLDPSDIGQLNYADLLHIDGHYYYLQGIQNYVVGTRMRCDVTLRKFLNPQQVDSASVVCEALGVGSISDGGIVTFVDRDGNDIESTEACCEYYGGGDWVWNSYTNTCSTGQTTSEPYIDEDGADAQGLTYTPDNYDYVGGQGVSLSTGNTDIAESLATTYRFQLQGFTSLLDTYASTLSKRDEFLLPQNCVVSVVVKYQAKVKEGTNKDDMFFGDVRGVVRVVDGVASVVAPDANVSELKSPSLPLPLPPVEVEATHTNGVNPTIRFLCREATGQKLMLALDVTMRVQSLYPTLVPYTQQSMVTQLPEPLVTQAYELLSYQ